MQVQDPAVEPVAATEARLKISEIFVSIQGESDSVGWPTVFVRLTGCPLRCVWCDTEYAFHGGHWQSIDEILGAVRLFGTRHVCVTGGEPLAQKRCVALLKALCDEGYEVSLETSGALDISEVDARVRRVVDLKAPGSGEQRRNRIENLDLLRPHDQIKIVIANRGDYEWAREIVASHQLTDRVQVLFSPVHGSIRPVELAEWILADRLPVRFQLQLHKLLWGDVPGH